MASKPPYCRNCSNKDMRELRITRAFYTSSGEIDIRIRCDFCGHEWTRTTTNPPPRFIVQMRGYTQAIASAGKGGGKSIVHW